MKIFDPELFKELAFLPENGLMDRKVELYRVYGRNTLESRANFIKDMIALANTARRRGKPAYLFLGVRDKLSSGEEPLPGIGGQWSRPTPLPAWDTLEKQQEGISKDYHRIIEEYVSPHMDFEYLSGFVDGQLVGYILIDYNRHEVPFEVKKRLDHEGNVFLERGQCWQRSGESNYLVPPHEKSYLYRHDDVPYVSKEAWEKYVGRCIEAYQLDFEPEIPLEISSSESERVDWNEQISQWTDSREHHILLLTGGPGTGKTTTLKRTMYWLSSNLLANLQAIRAEEQPNEPIPIYVDLNERSFDNAQTFKRELVSRLDEFGYLDLRRHPQPYAVLEQGGQRFVILLDGIDEIESTNARRTHSVIRGVMDTNPFSMQFLVSGRTIGIPHAWSRRYPVFQIEPVEYTRVRQFLDGVLEDTSEAWNYLVQDDELLQLISSPLAIKAFTEQWRQWEKDQEDYLQQRIERKDAIRPDPPTVAGVIEAVLSKLLHHDLDKGILVNESDLYEQLTRLGKLALWLKINDLEMTLVDQAKDILEESVYEYGRRLTLLRIQDGRVCFGSTLLFDYLAVYRLKELLERSTGAPPIAWERCGRMLESLIADLLPLLIDGYVRSQPEIAKSAIA